MLLVLLVLIGVAVLVFVFYNDLFPPAPKVPTFSYEEDPTEEDPTEEDPAEEEPPAEGDPVKDEPDDVPAANGQPSGTPAVGSLGTPATAAKKPQSDLDKVGGLIKDNKMLLASIGTMAIAEIVIKKLVQRVTGRVEMGLGKYVMKMASRVATRLAEKIGVKLARKLGVSIATKVATSAATKIGAQLAAHTAAAASTGPAFPFVEAGLLAFDVLSIGLDIGDAGGYMKMGTKKTYLGIKKQIDAEVAKAYAKENLPYPRPVGPMDKFSAKELSEHLAKFAPNVEDIVKRAAGKLFASQTEMEDWIGEQVDAQSGPLFEAACKDLGGVVVKDSCMYKDKASCESSYSIPPKEDDTYAEWRNGECLSAAYGMRLICASNDIAYDTGTGICTIDKNYCTKKGADWSFDKSINDYDCSIGDGQKFAEFIFGTTITRGLVQAFDESNYEKCRPGTSETGTQVGGAILGGLAAGMTGGQGVALGVAGGSLFCSGSVCPEGTEKDAGLCYKPCKEGYKGVGPVCWEECPDGYTDFGATCTRSGCGPGQTNNAGICYDNCKDGYKNVLSTCLEKGCKDGYTDVGLTCHRPLHVYGKGCCCTIFSKKCCGNCKPGYNDDGCTCRRGPQTYAKDSYIQKPQGSSLHTKNKDSYGRGVGVVPKPIFYPKKRVVPYSTKDN